MMNKDTIAFTRKKFLRRSSPFLRVMKLLLVLVLTTIFQVHAITYGQSVTLNVKNASFKSVFEALRKQTGYHFLYKTEMLSQLKNININVSNVPLAQVLERCFAGQPLTYEINEIPWYSGKNLQD